MWSWWTKAWMKCIISPSGICFCLRMCYFDCILSDIKACCLSHHNSCNPMTMAPSNVLVLSRRQGFPACMPMTSSFFVPDFWGLLGQLGTNSSWPIALVSQLFGLSFKTAPPQGNWKVLGEPKEYCLVQRASDSSRGYWDAWTKLFKQTVVQVATCDCLWMCVSIFVELRILIWAFGYH